MQLVRSVGTWLGAPRTVGTPLHWARHGGLIAVSDGGLVSASFALVATVLFAGLLAPLA